MAVVEEDRGDREGDQAEGDDGFGNEANRKSRRRED